MTEVVTEESGGKKGDGGKPMWELVDYEFLDRLIDVLTFGVAEQSSVGRSQAGPQHGRIAEIPRQGRLLRRRLQHGTE